MKTEKQIKRAFRRTEARDALIRAVFSALISLWVIGFMIAVVKAAGII